jgi:3-oxoacyl-[acyl-carrier-protein] synthase II
MVLGSVGCFLVVESREHALARGATPLAHIAAIATDRCRRSPGEATTVAHRQLEAMRDHLGAEHAAVISGASGAPATTTEEAEFLRGLRLPVRATATALGHSLEPSFPANLALAATCLSKGRLFAPLEADEPTMDGELRQVLVTSWGHWRGEALAVVEAA